MNSLCKEVLDFITHLENLLKKHTKIAPALANALAKLFTEIKAKLEDDFTEWNLEKVIHLLRVLTKLQYIISSSSKYQKLLQEFAKYIEENNLLQTTNDVIEYANSIVMIVPYFTSLNFIENLEVLVAKYPTNLREEIICHNSFARVCNNLQDFVYLAKHCVSNKEFYQLVELQHLQATVTNLNDLILLMKNSGNRSKVILEQKYFRSLICKFSDLMQLREQVYAAIENAFFYPKILDLIPTYKHFLELTTGLKINGGIFRRLDSANMRFFPDLTSLLHSSVKLDDIVHILQSDYGCSLVQSFADILQIKLRSPSLLSVVLELPICAKVITSVEQIVALTAGVNWTERNISAYRSLGLLVPNFSAMRQLPKKLAVEFLKSRPFAERVITSFSEFYEAVCDYPDFIDYSVQSAVLAKVITKPEQFLLIYAHDRMPAIDKPRIAEYLYKHPQLYSLKPSICLALQQNIKSSLDLIHLSRIVPAAFVAVLKDEKIAAYLSKSMVINFLRANPDYAVTLFDAVASYALDLSVTEVAALYPSNYGVAANLEFLEKKVHSYSDYRQVSLLNQQLALEILANRRIKRLVMDKSHLIDLSNLKNCGLLFHTFKLILSSPDMQERFTLEELSKGGKCLIDAYKSLQLTGDLIKSRNDLFQADKLDLIDPLSNSDYYRCYINTFSDLLEYFKNNENADGLVLTFKRFAAFVTTYAELKLLAAFKQVHLPLLLADARIASLINSSAELIDLLRGQDLALIFPELVKLPIFTKLLITFSDFIAINRIYDNAIHDFFGGIVNRKRSSDLENLCQLSEIISDETSNSYYIQVMPPLQLLNSMSALVALAEVDYCTFRLVNGLPVFVKAIIASDFRNLLQIAKSNPKAADTLMEDNTYHSLITNLDLFIAIVATGSSKMYALYSTLQLAEKLITKIDDLLLINDRLPALIPFLVRSAKLTHLITSVAQIEQLQLSLDLKHQLILYKIRTQHGKRDLAENDYQFKEIQKTPRVSALADTNSSINSQWFEVVKHSMTFAEYFNLTQFGPNGYYTKGRIKFTSDNAKGHYYTAASQGRALAVSLAERLFQQWRVQRKSSFKILEIGAGDGDLCAKILTHLQNKAYEHAEYAAFLDAIHYQIVDKSPALNMRQKSKLASYGDKVSVHNGDAMHLHRDEFEYLHSDIIISNELMDMFPPDKIYLSSDGSSLRALLVIPMIEPAMLQEVCNFNQDAVERIMQKSHAYQVLFEIKNDNNPTFILLDKETFYELFNQCDTEKLKLNAFQFSEFYVPLRCIPYLETYIQENPETLYGMKPRTYKHIQVGLASFMQGIAKRGDIILSIDYGRNTEFLVNAGLRTYGEGKPSSFVYGTPGLIDMTVDVDFSLQAVRGMHEGLQYHGCFLQAGLTPDSLVSNPDEEVSKELPFYALSEVNKKRYSGLSASETSDFRANNLFYFSLFAKRNVQVGFAVHPKYRLVCLPSEIDTESYEKTLRS